MYSNSIYTKLPSNLSKESASFLIHSLVFKFTMKHMRNWHLRWPSQVPSFVLLYLVHIFNNEQKEYTFALSRPLRLKTHLTVIKQSESILDIAFYSFVQPRLCYKFLFYHLVIFWLILFYLCNFTKNSWLGLGSVVR